MCVLDSLWTLDLHNGGKICWQVCGRELHLNCLVNLVGTVVCMRNLGIGDGAEEGVEA